MNKIISIIFIISILSFSAFAQTNKKADKQYDNLAYMSAVETYQKTGEPSDAQSIRQLANSYRLNGDYNAATTYYRQLMTQSPSSGDMLFYAQSLLATGKCDEAITWFKKYQEEAGEQATQRKFITDCSELDAFAKKSITVTPLSGANSELLDFAAVPFRDGVVFTSSRGEKQSCRDSWTGTGYTDMFVATLKEGKVEKVTPLNEETNQRFHDGVATFNKAGTVMYFTRNQANTGENSTRFLKIFSSKYRSGSWSDAEELPINGDNFSTCHPTLSADGRKLYFASDRTGGKGGMDIWVSELQNGKWASPKNLSAVNTSGNETFPYVNEQNIVFFASDGQKGMGGLDIFKLENNEVENLGTPLNSSYDDFAYAETLGDKAGYISSNRKGGQGGDDDIFQWQVTENQDLAKDKNLADAKNKPSEYDANAKPKTPEFPTTYKVRVIAIDAKNGQPLVQPLITIAGANRAPKPELRNNIEMEIFPNGQYTILAENDGYQAHTVSVSGIEMLKSPDYYLPLLKNNTPSFEGKVLKKGEIIIVNDIYYDYNKANIRSDASVGLKRLADVMLKYPTLEVELSSHTDSRGKTAYNNKLSQRRAEEAVTYLVSRGIATDRMKAKGYGERKLTNNCADGINCNEEEHQKNRRTEVRILRFDEEGVEIKKQ
jgi:outer membrane protein OmpA-like peptidoglycan-associated protein